jgi:transcriptional regulator of acetoin/glycerol metabolism
MDDWRGPRSRPAARAEAGLVLLYATNHEALPAAFPFDAEVALAGREAGTTIVIPQKAVSRVHVRFAQDDGKWTITDLDSRNGTVVRGRPLRNASTVLHENDEVRIGDAIFKFVATDARAFVPYRLEGPSGDAPPITISGAVGGLRMARISSELDTIAPTQVPVVVLGETGSGKEVVARGLHEKSGRRGPLRAINCASIPANLVESELFGYKRGAFTGATQDHAGMIRAADGGTLVLDEIGDMPLEAQAKLLRTLETREVVPVGAVTGIPVDVRIVAATHRHLPSLVAGGLFRADLYARLNGYTITLPPLRQRKEDLLKLVRHWLKESGNGNRPVDFGFMVALCHYDWPYNVRELAAAIRRAVALAGEGELQAKHLPAPVLERMESYGLDTPEVERQSGTHPEAEADGAGRGRRPTNEELDSQLTRHHGNVSAVARDLGKDRALVGRWIRAAGLDPESYRN